MPCRMPPRPSTAWPTLRVLPGPLRLRVHPRRSSPSSTERWRRPSSTRRPRSSHSRRTWTSRPASSMVVASRPSSASCPIRLRPSQRPRARRSVTSFESPTSPPASSTGAWCPRLWRCCALARRLRSALRPPPWPPSPPPRRAPPSSPRVASPSSSKPSCTAPRPCKNTLRPRCAISPAPLGPGAILSTPGRSPRSCTPWRTARTCPGRTPRPPSATSPSRLTWASRPRTRGHCPTSSARSPAAWRRWRRRLRACSTTWPARASAWGPASSPPAPSEPSAPSSPRPDTWTPPRTSPRAPCSASRRRRRCAPRCSTRASCPSSPRWPPGAPAAEPWRTSKCFAQRSTRGATFSCLRAVTFPR
mmetsp:Transcript_624/g.1740  ORF Transcript_624/g.1740 Transcript_624/m.1740 type:complete len:361 (-) Transcript_624:1072-2154(-)